MFLSAHGKGSPYRKTFLSSFPRQRKFLSSAEKWKKGFPGSSYHCKTEVDLAGSDGILTGQIVPVTLVLGHCSH